MELRNAVVVGGNRTPFTKSGGKFAAASAQDLLTAALDGLVSRFGLAGRQMGQVTAGAGLKSLAEPWADTTSPAGRMVLTVFAGIAEFERALIHQRTSHGRIAAKARGVRFGRPSKLTTAQRELAARLIAEGQSIRQTAEVVNCHPATLYRALSGETAPRK